MDLTLKTEKHHARVIDWVGGNDNFAVAGQRQRSRARWGHRRSSSPLARSAYRAAKLLPHARCRRSAKCPGPVLLVTSRPRSRRRLLLRPLLAIRILCAVLRILPAVGLVRHRPSLVVVIAVPCFGPPANAADSPRFGRESALQVSSAFNTTTQSHKTSAPSYPQGRP